MDNVYVSSSCLKDKRDLFKVLDIYQSLAIDKVELSSSHSFLTEKELQRLEDYKFKYLVHNYFPPPQEPLILNLASMQPKNVLRSFIQAKKGIDYAASIKSNLYTVHPGYRQDPDLTFNFPKDIKPNPYNLAFETLVEKTKKLAEYAMEMDVCFGVENDVCFTQESGDVSNYCVLCDIKQFESFFHCLNGSTIGLLMDLGHLKVNANRLVFGKKEFLQKFRDRIIAFHLSENNGYIDSHDPLTKSSWFLEILKEFPAEVPKVLEIRDAEIDDVKKSLDILYGL